MPTLTINTNQIDDIRAGIQALKAILDAKMGRRIEHSTQPQRNNNFDPLQIKLGNLKHKGIWPFIAGMAGVPSEEFSLPELGNLLGLSSAKVCSLRAILRKPEKRLGLAFLELAPSGSVDESGNPRYAMPPMIRDAVRRESATVAV